VLLIRLLLSHLFSFPLLFLLLILLLTKRPGTFNLLNYIPKSRIISKETTVRLLLVRRESTR